jgi:ferredoxin
MKITVDRDSCMGHSQCLLAAPAVFDLDDDGVVVVRQEAPPEAEWPAVRDAAARCPERVITLAE